MISRNSDILDRYTAKIENFCAGINPFMLKQSDFSISALPKNVSYFDIVDYLIERESEYTKESFKAYKSLEAYKMYEAGWIQYLGSKKVTTGEIVFGKVKHSQKISLKPVACWVAVDSNGSIQTAHCTCMAGLGEACSHIGAVLFALEAWSRKDQHNEKQSCTDILNQWLVPSTRKIDFAEVKDIYRPRETNMSSFKVPEATKEELHDFLAELLQEGEKPVICHFTTPKLNLQMHHYDDYKSIDFVAERELLDLLFCQFFKAKLIGSNLEFLRNLGRNEINKLNYSKSIITKITSATSNQSKSWFGKGSVRGELPRQFLKQLLKRTQPLLQYL